MLNQKIRATIAQFKQALPAELSALIEQGAGEISALDVIERARKVGDSAPDLSGPSLDRPETTKGATKAD